MALLAGRTRFRSSAQASSPMAAHGATASSSVRSSIPWRSARPASVNAPSPSTRPRDASRSTAAVPLVVGPLPRALQIGPRDLALGGVQHQRLAPVDAGLGEAGDVAVAPVLAEHGDGVPQRDARLVGPRQGEVGGGQRATGQRSADRLARPAGPAPRPARAAGPTRASSVVRARAASMAAVDGRPAPRRAWRGPTPTAGRGAPPTGGS